MLKINNLHAAVEGKEILRGINLERLSLISVIDFSFLIIDWIWSISKPVPMPKEVELTG